MSFELPSNYKEWRVPALLWFILICGFSVLFFLTREHNEKVEKRNQIRLMGCSGGLGKVATPYKKVCIFRSKELFYRFDRILLGSLIGDGIYKDDIESRRRFHKSQDEFIKLLDEGNVYFVVSNDTQVRFIETSNNAKPSIHVSIVEGEYKGMTGWIHAKDYYCLDWETPKNQISGRSTQDILEGLIRSRRLKK